MRPSVGTDNAGGPTALGPHADTWLLALSAVPFDMVSPSGWGWRGWAHATHGRQRAPQDSSSRAARLGWRSKAPGSTTLPLCRGAWSSYTSESRRFFQQNYQLALLIERAPK